MIPYLFDIIADCVSERQLVQDCCGGDAVACLLPKTPPCVAWRGEIMQLLAEVLLFLLILLLAAFSQLFFLLHGFLCSTLHPFLDD